jgi:hypothetical protein
MRIPGGKGIFFQVVPPTYACVCGYLPYSLMLTPNRLSEVQLEAPTESYRFPARTATLQPAGNPFVLLLISFMKRRDFP